MLINLYPYEKKKSIFRNYTKYFVKIPYTYTLTFFPSPSELLKALKEPTLNIIYNMIKS